MPSINGKQIETYDLDTIESFKIRVASVLNTLPEYLYFEDNSNLSDFHNKESNIIVIDLLELIKKSADENSSIINVIETILEMNNNFNIKDYVLPQWFVYNNKLIQQYKNSGGLILRPIIDSIILKKIKNINTSFSIENIWKNNLLNLKGLIDKIEKNKQLDNENKKNFKYIKDSITCKHTDFNIEYIVSSLTLEEKDSYKIKLSLLELFNECILTSYVPFVTTNQFYKITNDFVPSEKWIESSDNSLILKVASKDRLEKENYTNTIIKIDDLYNVTAEIMIYTNTSEGNVSKDEYTKRFLNVFKTINLFVKESKESKISGLFYFPNKKINKYIFSDLVMNDYLFNSFIKIDEHEGATKNKTYIFIQFYHPNTGLIKANISQKISNKSTRPPNVDETLFPDKSYYISVKVKDAVDTASVLLFQTILGKLLTIYDTKAPDIIKYYSTYIEDFEVEDEEDEEQEETKKISELAPEIFVSNYTRNCPPARMPIAITEEDINRVQKDRRSFIKFPRDIQDDSKFIKLSTDGVNQHSYMCNTSQYKYIGLTKNKLKNADKFPYVPCCFKTDQTNKPKYLDYYKGQEIVALDKTNDKDIIKTYKMLDPDRFGQMPPNIENLFTFIYPNQTHEYIRKGVFKNEHSFLNCVLEALNYKNILSITDKEEREVKLIDYRLKLTDKNLVALCRQEMYDYSTDKIITMLKDPYEYLDPKLFIHLLEGYFKCNIFIFTKSNIFSDGEIILPRHSHAYYKNKNNYPCIYIYEHLFEKQCELIIKYNIVKKENPQYSFSYTEAKNIRLMFSKLRESYSLDKPIKEIQFGLPSNIQILSQYIDSYGKTRRLNLRFNDSKLTLITSPIQPIIVKETKKQIIYKTPLNTALDFIKELEIKLDSKTIINNVLYEINFTLGNVQISIPIKETKEQNIELKDVIEQKNLSFNDNTFSALEQFNKNKKIARYLMEYTIWLYSKYLHNENINEINNENIITFSRTKFLINPTFKYGIVSKTFTLESSLMENGLIVVHDIDTLKRLIYYLRLSIQRNTKNVIEYYTKNFIQNYYVDITDFNKHTNQLILFGDESIQNLINENNIKYTINNYIQIGLNIPYFFKNKLIDDKVYLAQNATSIEKAYDISTTWNTDGYNKGIFAENRKPVSFNLYSYTSAYNIKKHSIKKNSSSSEDVNILGYKIEDKPYYTVLLSLS